MFLSIHTRSHFKHFSCALRSSQLELSNSRTLDFLQNSRTLLNKYYYFVKKKGLNPVESAINLKAE